MIDGVKSGGVVHPSLATSLVTPAIECRRTGAICSVERHMSYINLLYVARHLANGLIHLDRYVNPPSSL